MVYLCFQIASETGIYKILDNLTFADLEMPVGTLKSRRSRWTVRQAELPHRGIFVWSGHSLSRYFNIYSVSVFLGCSLSYVCSGMIINVWWTTATKFGSVWGFVHWTLAWRLPVGNLHEGEGYLEIHHRSFYQIMQFASRQEKTRSIGVKYSLPSPLGFNSLHSPLAKGERKG